MRWVANLQMRVQTPLWPSSIAQLVEHVAVNHRVVGSSPTWGESFQLYDLICLGSSVGRVKD